MAGGSSPDWRGRKVLDRDGDKLGKLEAVYLDRQTDEPKWGLVKGGPFRASKLVPLGEASDDGKELRIPVARGRVKRASDASAGDELRAREESELDDHYGTTSSGERSSEAPPPSDQRERTDMSGEDRGERSRQGEPAAGRSGRGGEREAFGGFKFGAALIGWLIATFLAVILTAVAGAITGLVGANTGAPAPGSAGVAAIVGAVVVLVVLALAYFVGGYVAGRMARFNGPKQGLGVWVIGVVVTIVLAIVGAVFGSQYDVLARLNLPSVPLDAGTVGIGALISLLLVAVGTLLAAMGGGKLGTRYHRKVDRVGTRA